MASSEFDIIRRYFARFSKQRDWLAVGIGDDAAVINPAAGHQLLVSIDTLNAGIHFPPDTSASDIGYKSLAVNISDIASMGGEPKWFTLSLSLPTADEQWLSGFCAGLSKLVDEYDLTLVGGDTTRGPLSITIQIAGEIPDGLAISRSGAKPGDDIFVTGYLGSAATGLLVKQNKISLDTVSAEEFLHALNRPVPRVSTGKSLRELAHACIDISDGLAADLGHIVAASHAGAEIELNSIPVSPNLLQQDFPAEQLQQLTLFGGDDYELCFTAAVDDRNRIENLAQVEQVPITRIGKIIAETGLFYHLDGERLVLPARGYDHFQ